MIPERAAKKLLGKAEEQSLISRRRQKFANNAEGNGEVFRIVRKKGEGGAPGRRGGEGFGDFVSEKHFTFMKYKEFLTVWMHKNNH